MASMISKSYLEQAAEAFATGAGVNIVLGSLGMVIVQLLFALPSLWKMIVWWVGGIIITVSVGMLIQRWYAKKRISWTILGGGIAIGVVLLMITSSFATFLFPWLPEGAIGLESGVQGPGIDISGPSYDFLFPAMLSAIILLFAFVVVIIKRH